jgi:hypothetical protein
MRSFILALGSFIVGAITSWLLMSIPHTSMSVQFASAQPRGFFDESAIPRVPPISTEQYHREFVGGVQQLDGLSCRQCVFTNTVLAYSGGAYRLTDAMFSGTPTLILRGAALNTMRVLQLFGQIPAGPRVPTFDRPFGDTPVPITLESSETSTK